MQKYVNITPKEVGNASPVFTKRTGIRVFERTDVPAYYPDGVIKVNTRDYRISGGYFDGSGYVPLRYANVIATIWQIDEELFSSKEDALEYIQSTLGATEQEAKDFLAELPMLTREY